MLTKQPQAPCATGCGCIPRERLRYFTGMYLTARDFSSEQHYFLHHARQHNRMLHGWGIICGLRVVRHPDPNCANRWVVVRAGAAIDCCGRTIYLCQDTPVELPLPRPAGEEQSSRTGEEPQTGPFLLAICYGEEEVEHVPALYSEGVCDPTRREASRVREVAHIRVLRLDEVAPDCWRVPGGGPDTACRDDCDDELPGPAGVCLEPECPCQECVPLALIHPTNPDTGYQSGFEIDTQGRRTLPVPPDFLTHISWINWPHGGQVSISQLRNDMGGRLLVRFDRKLLPAVGNATGISEYTFVVQYGGIQRDIEFLPFEPDTPPTLEEDCLAVFTIDPDYIDPDRRQNIAGNTVFISIKGDFILDCHENPVDADHLRGRLPSGDGVAGGIFESWFTVVPDEGNEEETA